MGLPFEQEAQLAALQKLRDELEGLLSGATDDRERMDAICAEYQAGKGQNAPVPEAPAAEKPTAVVLPFPKPPPAPEPVEEPGILTPVFTEAVTAKPAKKLEPKRAAQRSVPGQLAFRF